MTERKQKLSGAAYRKRRRQRDLERAQRLSGGGAVKPLSPSMLPAVRVEDLDTVAGNRRELSRIYGLARDGHLLPEVATRLAYLLAQNAGLCRIEQELMEARLIREQLLRLNGDRNLELLPVSPETPVADPATPSPMTIEGQS